MAVNAPTENPMKRCICFLFVACSACGGSSPTTPTPQFVPPPAVVTPVIQHANIQAAASGTTVCFTGLCTSLTWTVTNNGPGCATNLQAVFRAFGSDGAGPQLGVDIPMALNGGSLRSVLFRVGTSITLENVSPFNDVRSAHTVFKFFGAWTDVAC